MKHFEHPLKHKPSELLWRMMLAFSVFLFACGLVLSPWDTLLPGLAAIHRSPDVLISDYFVIGGMGAGKSTARKALTDEGLAWIDLDQVGHEVLMWDTVKDDLRGAFGDDIFDENGEVVRSALAAKAFATPAATRRRPFASLQALG